MQRYVGETLQEAMIDYGPPTNAFDMPDGSRAFQWVMNSTFVTPTTITNSGTVRPTGYSATWTQNTQITGGQPITSTCAYTMIARWDDARNAWVFTEYRRPRTLCE
ncbi:MAG: hypothetical protein DCF16_04190 [Alphaproteobacteria bacterium]|nr:MAG: hypothetical protein DCF16_04190 [Alphaproteobacteria bacterium]